jgi:hypothetical protein
MSKVGLPGAGVEPLAGPAPRSSGSRVRPVRRVDSPEQTSSADLRLIIEETGDPVQYVYTIVDRRTGKIVSQFLREEMLKRREEAGYAAGDVFDAKA